MQQCRRIFPLVDRVREVDALVAREADQARAQHLGHDFGRLGLATARLALDEERLLQVEREKEGRRQGAVADVAALAQTALDVLDGRGCAHADKGYEVVRPSTRIVRTNRPAVRSEPRIVRTIREGGPAWSAGPGHPQICYVPCACWIARLVSTRARCFLYSGLARRSPPGSSPSEACCAASSGLAPFFSASSTAVALTGVVPTLVRPMRHPPFSFCAATPTIAQSQS